MIEPVITAQIVKSLMDNIVIPKISDFASEIKMQWNLKVTHVNRHFGFDSIDKVYIEKADIEEQIKLIQAELDAQSNEFTF